MPEVIESSARGGENTASMIRQYLLRQFPLVKQLAPADSDPLLDSGVVDSLGILEIVSFLTEQFSVQVTDEDLIPENFASVTALAEFVQAKQKNPA